MAAVNKQQVLAIGTRQKVWPIGFESRSAACCEAASAHMLSVGTCVVKGSWQGRVGDAGSQRL